MKSDTSPIGSQRNAAWAWRLNTADVPTIATARSRAARSRGWDRISTPASVRLMALNRYCAMICGAGISV
jgi:hypothetical protein